MTRPFSLRDVGLVWCLRDRGIALDMQRAMLLRSQPLKDALWSLMPHRPAESTLTFVWHNAHGSASGFVQVLTCPDRQEWQVIHLSPWQSDGPSTGAALAAGLAGVCDLAGRRGAWRVRAGVVAGGWEEDVFRQAGFVPYAREEVYRLPNPAPCAAPACLRPLSPLDAWPLLHLIGQAVPPSVQHAEGLVYGGAETPLFSRLGVAREQGYVLERGGELMAYAGISHAQQAAWMRFWLHPEARSSGGDVLREAAEAAPCSPVLYCAVRDYQSGLRGPLAGMGASLVGVQVWLVKHTARPVECPRARAALEQRVEPLATPLHPASETMPMMAGLPARELWTYECCRRADHCAIGSD